MTTDLPALVAQRVVEAARGSQAVTMTPWTGGPLLLALRPHLLARALDNLLGNALRYGTRAEVTLRVHLGRVILTIEDDGPGITPEHFDRAKRPFVRLDPARGASRGSGVGLGLAIVADAMLAQGGTLELDRGQTPGLGGLVARLIVPLRRG